MTLTCACAPYAVRLSEEGMAAWLQRAQMSHAIRTPARNQLQVSACSMQGNLSLISLLVVLTVMPTVHHQPVQRLLPVWGCS